VKPGNILIGEDGRAKLADMGVGKSFSNKSDLTTHDQGVGTPLYMPWEQTLNATLVDARSDLFALGATYFHLVTGRVPFPGKTITEVNQLKDEGTFATPRVINPALPAIFDSIVTKMLARLPADRYQTADDLITALRLSGLADDHAEATNALGDTDTPAAHTCPDQTLVSPEQQATPNTNTIGVWYVRYENPIQGEIQIRAKTADIFKYVAEGLLPDEFYVGRIGEKKLRPVRTFAEFKNLPHPKPNSVPAQRRP
jgi:serine/threonine protein kinase